MKSSQVKQWMHHTQQRHTRTYRNTYVSTGSDGKCNSFIGFAENVWNIVVL